MKIGIFTRGQEYHSHKYETAFFDGLKTHGHNPKWYNWQDNPDIDLAVIWGINNVNLIKYLKERNIDYLVLERGYIGDRHEYTSCGFNGLNGHADFVNKDSDYKRLPLFEEYLKPVNPKIGSYWLIIGQVPSDASVRHIGFHKWLEATIQDIKANSDIPVCYRPHPIDAGPYIPNNVKHIKGDLHDAMKDAFCVVTCNSNVGVDAMLAGYNFVALDKGSMVFGKSINDNRKQWLADMSYTQWTLKELESGATWDHLKKFYNSA